MPTVLRPELPPQVDEVFGRVLAKRPDERYGTCREFIDAARMALGIPRTGTQSSLAHIPTTINPDTAAPPGRRTAPPPDQYSWRSQPSADLPGGGQPSLRAHGRLPGRRDRAGTGSHAGSPSWRPWSSW